MEQTEGKRIFVVDDDPLYVRMLKYIVELNPDHQVHVFTTGKECIDNLHLNPSVVTLDYQLPDMKGEDVLKSVLSFNPNIKTIILSGQQDVSTAVELIKLGAYDYITKDEETKDRLLIAINHIKEQVQLSEQVASLKSELTTKYEFGNTVKGQSSIMRDVFAFMEKAAKSNINVSVTGETGTGKEVIAKAIHYNSHRAKKPFMAFNISAIPRELVESELFGHEKGAFTGADSRRVGKFESAKDGTLFIDEIGEMEVSMQAKLLRVMQEREFSRIGSNDLIKLDARIIVATHRDLQEEVKKGNFREDLYYRMLGLPIHLPPLRDRDNDILILAKHFIKEVCEENKMNELSLSEPAAEKLTSHVFPGNVRELRAVIELAVIMANTDTIEPRDIHFKTPRSQPKFFSEEMSMKEYNRQIVSHFLRKYDNNVVKVAKKLEVGKSTIYRMLKEQEN